jgi:leucyl-tRNA synthetase
MDDVVIGTGNLAGKGVYANRAFAKGEVVIQYHLQPLTEEEYARLPKSEKMFTHSHWRQMYLYSEPYKVRMNRGIILAEDGRKMSKRWGNTINPDEQVANVGADSVRTYLAFIGPYNEVGSFPWSTNGLVGVRRFIERVADLPAKAADVEVPAELDILLNQTIKKVGEDIESMKFNTSVSQLLFEHYSAALNSDNALLYTIN